MDKIPSILFVLPSLAQGGAERVMLLLFKNMPSAEKYLLVLCDGGYFEKFLSDDDNHAVLGKKKVRYALLQLLLHIWKTKPSIIISTMAYQNFAILLLKPFMPRGTRIIVREATLPSYFLSLGLFKRMAAKAGYRLLYPLAYKVICPSQRIIDEFKTLYGLKANFQLLYNPVQTNLIRQAAESETFREITENLNFLCVGRLNHAKGYDRLIEGLHKLKHAGSWSLTILGEGAERQKLERLIHEYKLEDRVFLPGSVENPWGPMSKADLLILPSRREGLPNVALESLAAGTPVLAIKDAGGIQEIATYSSQNVCVVNTMDEMIDTMSQAKKLNQQSLRPSLLPAEFEIQTIITAFEQMLKNEAA